ncbi:MAG: DNA-binding protein HU [Hyphomicrobiales bacterium]|nr:MAG: DNA-binding protein HU [Hyphomicrobiales bacterium]
MNKNEIIAAVADKSDLSKADAGKAVEALLGVITDALKDGGDVRFVGFGTFSVSHRAATTGRDPRTGNTVQIAARNNARFKAGKALKDAVNS